MDVADRISPSNGLLRPETRIADAKIGEDDRNGPKALVFPDQRGGIRIYIKYDDTESGNDLPAEIRHLEFYKPPVCLHTYVSWYDGVVRKFACFNLSNSIPGVNSKIRRSLDVLPQNCYIRLRRVW